MQKTQLTFLILIVVLSFWIPNSLCGDETPAPSHNKLQEMFHFYYLPFDIQFKQGSDVNELFPMTRDKFGEFNELINPEDIKSVDAEWAQYRAEWRNKSLLLTTPVAIGETSRISQHIISHRIPLNRTAMDSLKIPERFQLTEALKGRTAEVQANVIQLRFAKSFLSELDSEKFNFFIFSPSWCESSKEYRALFESYFKSFPDPSLNLQSVVIEDPKEEIFDAKIFKELFPHNLKYSHELVPRFLAVETVNGKSTVYEEGAALEELFQRYFKSHRGYMNAKVSFFRNRATPAKPNQANLNMLRR